MAHYTVRRATPDDVDTLVRQRLSMFEDMGVLSRHDAEGTDVRLADAYRAWLHDLMPTDTYRAWLVDAHHDDTRVEPVAGGGLTIIPWPPGPRWGGTHLGFVYNVYTDPAHRGRGLGRRVMTAIHEHCLAHDVRSVALNASMAGQPLYQSLGYTVARSPMMFLPLG